MEAAPSSASRQVISCFGNAMNIDLNTGSIMDSAFLLVQNNSRGTF